MLIGNSFPEYIFIRACIISLRAVTPLAFLLLVLWLLGVLTVHPALATWFSVEVAFYLLVYLPIQRFSQQACDWCLTYA